MLKKYSNTRENNTRKSNFEKFIYVICERRFPQRISAMGCKQVNEQKIFYYFYFVNIPKY